MIENLNGFVYKRVSKLKDTQKMELNGFVFNVIKKRKSSVNTKSLINVKTIPEKENLKSEHENKNENDNLKNENVNPNISTLHQTKITDLLHIPENSIISPKIRFDESVLHKAVNSSICPHSTVKFDIKTINPPKSTKKPRPSFIESINRPSRIKPCIKIDPDLSLDSKVNSLLSQLIAQNNYDIKFEPVKITNPYDELITDYEQAIEDVRIEIESLECEIVKWNLLYEKMKKENEIDVPEMEECVVKCEYKNECKYKNVMNEMGVKIRDMKEEIAVRTVNLKDKVVKRYGNSRSVDPVLLLKKMSEM